MTSVSKIVYFDKLDDFVDDEYNNTNHRTTKMKPVDVKAGNYFEYNVNYNDKDPKFKIDDHLRISKYKNIPAQGYTPNGSEEMFVIIKTKNAVPWPYVVNDLNGEEIIGTFYKKELQKTNLE